MLLPAAAILVALAGLSVLSHGSPPPTVVDGLPVLSVGEVLRQRAAGGLRNQPVAVGGYWTDAVIGHSCVMAERSELEPQCNDGEYGITEFNEPILKIGRYVEIVYRARGPWLTPYLARDLDGLDALFGLPRSNGEQHAPVPIVVIGHFDDPLAGRCRPELRDGCLDRLVVERIAYFNPGAARWASDIPTIEPTPPPAPSHY